MGSSSGVSCTTTTMHPPPHTQPASADETQLDLPPSFLLLNQGSDQARCRPTTFLLRITSGGVHLYYRAPRTAALRNTIARLGWRIDSRGHGGYVVAAGSQLAQGPYRCLDNRAPIPLPQWLTDLLNPAAPLPVPRTGPVICHPDAYVRAALVNQSARVRAAYPGIRHRTLLSAANSLGRLVGTGLLDHAQAHAVLGDAARIHVGVEGFTAAEADRTITDGLTYAATRTHHRWH